MSLTLTNDEFHLLRDLIEKECGIEVNDEKVYLIENRLAKLVVESGCTTFGDFYQKARNTGDPKLKDKIIDAITTNETLWFRDETPFMILRDLLFPELITKIQRGEKENIRIWSAACSTGQEPYSVAMIVEEMARHGKISKERVQIVASDISSSALLLAKVGRYDAIAMSRGMIPEYRERYFEEQGRVSLLREEVRKMVTFQHFNLQNPFTSLGRFDIILLRNVAIYFAHDFKVELFKKIARALNPGGYLFLGASEILTGYSQEFEQREYGKGVFYQLKP